MKEMEKVAPVQQNGGRGTIGFKKIKCPYCGYKMPFFYGEKAESRGVFAKCKGRNCKRLFEIKIGKEGKN